MARNTMGQFISALRKANGLTQQDVADRLNVSNKAVSRWERDECAPDISLIPALAELLGVTCDELLKGERILGTEGPQKREPKLSKQVRNLINRTLSGFRTLIWISVTVAFIGLVCMFGISYGFFRPIIGFAVMLLFEACALILAVVALNKAKEIKNENELFEEAEEALTAKYSHQLGSYSFAAFFTIAASILLSLPLVLWIDDYVDSVLAIESYCSTFLWWIALLLALCYLKLKEPCAAWITGGKRQFVENTPGMQTVRRMNRIQLGLLLAGLFCSVLSVYLKLNIEEIGSTIAWAGSCMLGAGSILCPIVFFAKHKDLRKDILLPGIRNMLMTVPADAIMRAYTLWWSGEGAADGIVQYERHLTWDLAAIWRALGIALLIFVVFTLIDALRKRKKPYNGV